MFITCHEGLKCKKYDEEGSYDKKNMSLPKWGGSFDFNKVKCVFANICKIFVMKSLMFWMWATINRGYSICA